MSPKNVIYPSILKPHPFPSFILSGHRDAGLGNFFSDIEIRPNMTRTFLCYRVQILLCTLVEMSFSVCFPGNKVVLRSEEIRERGVTIESTLPTCWGLPLVRITQHNGSVEIITWFPSSSVRPEITCPFFSPPLPSLLLPLPSSPSLRSSLFEDTSSRGCRRINRVYGVYRSHIVWCVVESRGSHSSSKHRGQLFPFLRVTQR